MDRRGTIALWWICATTLVCVIVASLAIWRVMSAPRESVRTIRARTPEEAALVAATATRVRSAHRALDRDALTEPEPWWIGDWGQLSRNPMYVIIAPTGEFYAAEVSCEGPGSDGCGRVLRATDDHVVLEFTVEPSSMRLAFVVPRELRRVQSWGGEAIVSEERWQAAQARPDPASWWESAALVRRLPDPELAAPEPFELVPGVWIDESRSADRR